MSMIDMSPRCASRLIKNSIIALGFFVLTGCSKLSQENFDKLEMGMSLAEIEKHIGTHANCAASLGTQSCIWGNEGGRFVKIRFVAGAAVTFESEKL